MLHRPAQGESWPWLSSGPLSPKATYDGEPGGWHVTPGSHMQQDAELAHTKVDSMSNLKTGGKLRHRGMIAPREDGARASRLPPRAR